MVGVWEPCASAPPGLLSFGGVDGSVAFLADDRSAAVFAADCVARLASATFFAGRASGCRFWAVAAFFASRGGLASLVRRASAAFLAGRGAPAAVASAGRPAALDSAVFFAGRWSDAAFFAGGDAARRVSAVPGVRRGSGTRVAGFAGRGAAARLVSDTAGRAAAGLGALTLGWSVTVLLIPQARSVGRGRFPSTRCSEGSGRRWRSQAVRRGPGCCRVPGPHSRRSAARCCRG